MAPSYTQWWDANMLRYLPLPYHEVVKSCSSIIPLSPNDMLVDGYYEYYRPFEFSIVSDLFAFTVSHSVRYATSLTLKFHNIFTDNNFINFSIDNILNLGILCRIFRSILVHSPCVCVLESVEKK
jgi:hypothetical protein